MTSNQLAYWSNQEKIRSNLALEAETRRHNQEQERIGYQQAAASMLGAQASAANAATNRMLYSESVRHNTALEGIQQYGAETSRFGTVVSALTGMQDSSTKAYEADTHRMSAESEISLTPYKKMEMSARSFKEATDAAVNLGKGALSIASALLGLGG